MGSTRTEIFHDYKWCTGVQKLEQKNVVLE